MMEGDHRGIRRGAGLGVHGTTPTESRAVAIHRDAPPGGQRLVGRFISSRHLGWTVGRTDELNPFDDDNGSFLVLANDEEQHSVWSTFADVPAGRRAVYGEPDRAAYLDYIEQNWTRTPPKRLRERLAAGRGV